MHADMQDIDDELLDGLRRQGHDIGIPVANRFTSLLFEIDGVHMFANDVWDLAVGKCNVGDIKARNADHLWDY